MDRLRVDLTPIAFLVTIAQYNSLKASARNTCGNNGGRRSSFMCGKWEEHCPIQRTDSICPSSVPDQFVVLRIQPVPEGPRKFYTAPGTSSRPAGSYNAELKPDLYCASTGPTYSTLSYPSPITIKTTFRVQS